MKMRKGILGLKVLVLENQSRREEKWRSKGFFFPLESRLVKERITRAKRGGLSEVNRGGWKRVKSLGLFVLFFIEAR